MKPAYLKITAALVLAATMTACAPGAGHRFGEALQEIGKTPSQRMAEAVTKTHKEQEPALLKLRQSCSAGDQAACIDYQQARANQEADWQNVHAVARNEELKASIAAAHHEDPREKAERDLESHRMHTTNCVNFGATVTCSGD